LNLLKNVGWIESNHIIIYCMDWIDKQLDGLMSQIFTHNYVVIVTPNIIYFELLCDLLLSLSKKLFNSIIISGGLVI